MIEVRKWWKHEGMGGAAESPIICLQNALIQLKTFQAEGVITTYRSIGFMELTADQLKDWEEVVGGSTGMPIPDQPPKAEARKIESVPGFGFCRIVGSFFPRKFREDVLEPQLADAVADYIEACEACDEEKVKRLRYMIPLWLFCAIFAGAIWKLLGLAKNSLGTSKD